MVALLVVLFVVMPIAELAVLIQVSRGIGLGNTIFLLIAVSVVGTWLCKREGLGVLRRIQASLERRELPARELVDGFLILLAGALLIAPGFISDVLGVLLLLPPTRVVFRAVVLGIFERRARVVTYVGGRVRDNWSAGRDARLGQRVIDTTGADDP